MTGSHKVGGRQRDLTDPAAWSVTTLPRSRWKGPRPCPTETVTTSNSTTSETTGDQSHGAVLGVTACVRGVNEEENRWAGGRTPWFAGVSFPSPRRRTGLSTRPGLWALGGVPGRVPVGHKLVSSRDRFIVVPSHSCLPLRDLGSRRRTQGYCPSYPSF